MMILLVILVLGGYALYSMSPEERTRLKERLVATAWRARDEAARRHAEPEPFRDALRERTPWPLVMPALVAVNVIVFLMMGWGSTEPETLVGWGASFGPRTTNGEWWRLVASMFVHTGMFQLLVNCAALVQLGLSSSDSSDTSRSPPSTSPRECWPAWSVCPTIRWPSALAPRAPSSASTVSFWRPPPGLPSTGRQPRWPSRQPASISTFGFRDAASGRTVDVAETGEPDQRLDAGVHWCGSRRRP